MKIFELAYRNYRDEILSERILFILKNGSLLCEERLSETEVSELILKYRKEGDMDARDKLVENFLPLVKHIAYKYIKSPQAIDYTGTIDDLTQEGIIIMMDRLDKFDLDSNAQFNTYLTRVLDGFFKNEVKREKLFGKKTDVNLIGSRTLGNRMLKSRKVIDKHMNDDDNYMDRFSDPNSDFTSDMDTDSEQMLKKVIDMLPEKQRFAIIMNNGLFGNEEMTQEEIAEKYGVTKMAVNLWIKNAMGFLKDELGDLKEAFA